MAKKKTTKKATSPKSMKCPNCGNASGTWKIRGTAVILWDVDEIDSKGTIWPEDGVDWDEVTFDSKYEICCPACGNGFEVPDGFNVSPSWG